MELLYFLEGIRNPVLDAIMSFITLFGDETLFMALAMLMFWCVDKYRGYLVLCVGFVGTLINQFLKLTFRIPRPWVKDPNFTIVESAREAATGYSFPSGHTQNAVGTFGAIGVTARHKIERILCILLLALVPFSRMYLGVHTPLDVGVSILIAAALVAIFTPLMKYFANNPHKMNYFLWAMLGAAVAFLLFVELYPFPADIDPHNLASGTKNAYTLLGAIGGMCIAYPIERKYINFSTDAVWWVQIIKLVGGLGLTVGIKSGLKVLFNLIFGADFMPAHAIRYAAIVLFAALVWPLTFKFFSKLGSKKA